MDCRQIQPLLPFYVRSEIEAHLHSQVEAHLKQCSLCRRELQTVIELNQLLYAHVESTKVENIQNARRLLAAKLTPLAPPRILHRRAIVALVVTTLVILLTGTAFAVYNSIIVVEPSQSMALDSARRQALFPIWVSPEEKLSGVQEIDKDSNYTLLLSYTQNNGRQFSLVEMLAYGSIPWEQNEAEGNVRIIKKNIDINQFSAVLYETPIRNTEGKVTDWVPHLAWRAGNANQGTDITLGAYPASHFTYDEIIAIARSLERVSR